MDKTTIKGERMNKEELAKNIKESRFNGRKTFGFRGGFGLLTEEEQKELHPYEAELEDMIFNIEAGRLTAKEAADRIRKRKQYEKERAEL